jgi:hypothetical protein
MKILSREIKTNEETFAPEMILTISIPMELAKEGDLEINQYEFDFDAFLKAVKESDERKLAYSEAIEEAIEHAKELLGIKVKL